MLTYHIAMFCLNLCFSLSLAHSYKQENTLVVRAGRYGFVKFKYRLQAETARKELNGKAVSINTTTIA
jgi:hypothetical protein